MERERERMIERESEREGGREKECERERGERKRKINRSIDWKREI